MRVQAQLLTKTFFIQVQGSSPKKVGSGQWTQFGGAPAEQPSRNQRDAHEQAICHRTTGSQGLHVCE